MHLETSLTDRHIWKQNGKMLISRVQILAGEISGLVDDSSLKSMHDILNTAFTLAMQQWPIKIS